MPDGNISMEEKYFNHTTNSHSRRDEMEDVFFY